MSSDPVSAPPRLALAILSLTADRADRVGLLGDVTEEFGAIALERGPDAAARWCWSQALRSVGPLLLLRLESPDVTRSVGGTTAGVVAAIASANLIGLILDRISGLGPEASLAAVSVVVAACALLACCVGLGLGTRFCRVGRLHS